MKYCALLAPLLLSCATPPSTAVRPAAWVGDTQPFGTAPRTPAIAPGGAAAAAAPPTASPVATRYRESVDKILAAARADRGAYEKLQYLTDRIGNRLAGSVGLEQAIAWAAKAMKDDGHDVRVEKVMVPHWVRGAESAELVAPVARPLRVLALGSSIATPKAGITAPVVVVRSWDELEAKQAQVKGAIVLYDVAMPAWSEAKGSGYGETVQYRGAGAIRAAKYGAKAVLVRSVTAHSLRTPHTGNMHYADDAPKIPALSVATEDAALLARLAAQGPVTVRVKSEARTLPDAPSANVIGELRGREKPDEVVVIGGHIDSWDVGQGAHDDGAGVVGTMQALTTLRRLGLTPRRTIRVVLFTNEENGVAGGKGYAKAHADELPRHVFALESDSGGFAPRGFSIGAKPEIGAKARGRLAEIAALLAPVGATKIVEGHGGTDVGMMEPAGVVTAELMVDNRTYFDIHHTDADTLDKVDPAQLADNVAAIAAMAYVVADLPERIDAP